MKTIFNYTIYQLGPESDRFKRWEDLPEGVDTVDLEADKYQAVYSFKLMGNNAFEVLDSLYFIFNMARPDDFQGHSLSVSDIVMMNDQFYFCSRFGWKEITGIHADRVPVIPQVRSNPILGEGREVLQNA